MNRKAGDINVEDSEEKSRPRQTRGRKTEVHPKQIRIFHAELGLRVEVLDFAAYNSKRGQVRCRRQSDGKEIMVEFDKLTEVLRSTAQDEPRELFAHKGLFWHDPAE